MKNFLFIILTILLFAIPSHAEFFRDVIVTSPNGIWTDSRAYSTLNDAIAAVGTNERTIKIVSPQVVTSLTVPSNVTLSFERDGSITNSGQLTINTRNIIAKDRQIFTGTGDIDFAVGSVVRSAWFSDVAKAISITNDDELTLIISKPSIVTSSCAVGNKVTLKILNGGQLDIDAGKTVTINGPFNAGLYQVFSGDGSVAGTPIVGTVYPQWYGASTTSTNGTNNAAFTRMATHASNVGNVMVSGMFTFNAVYRPPTEVKFQGDTSAGSICGFIGKHTGAAVVSLKGNQRNIFEDINIRGDATTIPKTGIVCGRSSAVNAGIHQFNRVIVNGSYSIAAVYNIASEVNQWIDSTIYVSNGTAARSLYISATDALAVDGLTSGSMVLFTMTGGTIHNSVANSSGINIVEDADSVINLSFKDLTIFGDGLNSYVLIDITNGVSGFGHYTFENIHIESATAQYGIYVKNTSGVWKSLKNISISKWSPTPKPGTNFLYTDDNVKLQWLDLDHRYYTGTTMAPVSIYCLQESNILLGNSALTIRSNSISNKIIVYKGHIVISGNSSADTIWYDESNYNLSVTGTETGALKRDTSFGLPLGQETLLSRTNVAFNADGDTAIFTVPNGVKCLLTKAIIVSGSSVGTTTTISIGNDGAEDNFIPANTLSNLNAINRVGILMPIPNTTPIMNIYYGPTAVIDARVANHSGGATNTLYLFGLIYGI